MTRKFASEHERGAALLSVLLLVAVMSVAAVAMLEATLGSLKRAKLTDAQAQVNWLVTGAEEAGLAGVTGLLETTDGRLTALTSQLQRPQEATVAGGTITTILEDASNCFNLNMLAASSDEQAGSVTSAALYQTLLGALELNENNIEDLTSALIDWLDADNRPEFGGAEDSYYASLQPAYRTGNAALLSTLELRAIRGYSAELFGLLQPLVCARRDTQAAKLNINTLTPRQAPLLVMAFSGQLDLRTASDVIGSRPPDGWPSVEAFLETEAIERVAVERRRIELLSLQSSHIRLRGKIVAGSDVTEFQTLYARQPGQPPRIVARSYGAVL